jgi:hypothetical protein
VASSQRPHRKHPAAKSRGRELRLPVDSRVTGRLRNLSAVLSLRWRLLDLEALAAGTGARGAGAATAFPPRLGPESYLRPLLRARTSLRQSSTASTEVGSFSSLAHSSGDITCYFLADAAAMWVCCGFGFDYLFPSWSSGAWGGGSLTCWPTDQAVDRSNSTSRLQLVNFALEKQVLFKP